MTVSESAVNDALKSEDIESLIEAGAPDDEYTSEAQSIVKALALIDDCEVSEESVAGVIRSTRSRFFGPFCEGDLDLRMPSFRKVARKILSSDTKSSRSAQISPRDSKPLFPTPCSLFPALVSSGVALKRGRYGAGAVVGRI